MVMQTDLSLNNHHLLGSIYDKAFSIEQGKMVMQKDLSLNNHRLLGSVHYINGFLKPNCGINTFTLNGNNNILIPNGSVISTIKMLHSSLTN